MRGSARVRRLARSARRGATCPVRWSQVVSTTTVSTTPMRVVAIATKVATRPRPLPRRQARAPQPIAIRPESGKNNPTAANVNARIHSARAPGSSSAVTSGLSAIAWPGSSSGYGACGAAPVPGAAAPTGSAPSVALPGRRGSEPAGAPPPAFADPTDALADAPAGAGPESALAAVGLVMTDSSVDELPLVLIVPDAASARGPTRSRRA
ncbi:exported hypothetical protein [Frankia canadensis]|uniref:Uncharacterized protein n=1 Tax=Frankia canadensis TaxID=1836972 RepID=A0A2I2KWE4_9ACTN|nr:exported hypothetical protein [Frankia canadensis]SOU57293.1 exported hypothetical protein [Frankia canadensis]